MENESKLEEDRSNEGRKRERTLVYGSWGLEVGLNGRTYNIIVNLGLVSGKSKIGEVRSRIGMAEKII